MYKQLLEDSNRMEDLLQQVVREAAGFLQSLGERPAVVPPPRDVQSVSLPIEGLGAEAVLAEFLRMYSPYLPASVGPRYFGFVTGGVTPAALMGDWLTGLYDQNGTGHSFAATRIEQQAIGMLRELFHLSDAHSATFVSGATMANFVGLACARQWIGSASGIDVAAHGLGGMPPIRVFSGAPHSTIFKALSMLGIGRNALQLVPCLPDRQAVDVSALREALRANGEAVSIVVANAGDVNTVDFDDLAAIASLKEEFRFWLHVDGAFGGFAACSPKYAHLLNGMEEADSITIDAHKWLNVPYDSAMQFTRHPQLQLEVFQNNAPYLGAPSATPEYHHLGPESSRRLRALAAWFSLLAYGKEGYREIVERDCELAALLGEKLTASRKFRLLAPVRMNVVCFTLADRADISSDLIQRFLRVANAQGTVGLTPTHYQGTPGFRAALSNWRTTQEDIDIACRALCEAADQLKE